MHGRETPRPLQSSPLCGWPGLSTGEKWEPALESAEAAGGLVVAGISLLLCNFTGVSA